MKTNLSQRNRNQEASELTQDPIEVHFECSLFRPSNRLIFVVAVV